mgnify:CR=1 FL=1
MKKLYVLNGLPESGKTTFGKLVGEILEEKGIPFLHTSSINVVKDILKPSHLWSPELQQDPATKVTLLQLKTQVVGNLDWDGVTKDEFWRKAMSELKLLINRHNQFFINEAVLKQFKNLSDSYNKFVGFVDIRESESIQQFAQHAEVFGYRVEKILVKSEGGANYNNFSDRDILNTKYDIIIDNSRRVFRDEASLHFLRVRAMSFVENEVLDGRPKERIY